MTLFLSEQFEIAWAGKDPFEEVEKLQGEVFRELEHRKTLRFALDGKNYFVKIHYGIGCREFFGNLVRFRLPVLGAANEFAAVRRLEKLGIDTMQVAGFGCRGFNPVRQKSFIITEELTDTESLEEYCASWKTEKPDFHLKYALIKKVAGISQRMHDHGLNHRDYYICHFLMNPSQVGVDGASANVKLYLIDLHRAQLRSRRTPRRWRMKDIASLYFSVMAIGLTRRDLYRFMCFYSGVSLRECLADKDRFWRGVERQGQRLWRRKLRKGDRI